MVAADGETWLDTARGIDLPPERRRCGYLFQEYALFPHLSAWQNVAYPLRGLPRRERRARALELLERFGLARPRRRAPAHALRRRAPARGAGARARARARACCCSTSRCRRSTRAPAPAPRASSASVLREVEVPALLVTHDFAEAAQLGDRVGVIDAGRVVQEGTPTELAAAPALGVRRRLHGRHRAHRAAGARRGRADARGARRRRRGREHRPGQAPVAVSVYPWEIAHRAGRRAARTARRRTGSPPRCSSVTTVGNRVRLGLAAPQPLAAEITAGLRRAARARGGCQRRRQLEGGGHAARVGLVVPVPAAVERLEQVVDRRVAGG